jgi:uncharacterized protein CbrC (UPF0167 family)
VSGERGTRRLAVRAGMRQYLDVLKSGHVRCKTRGSHRWTQGEWTDFLTDVLALIDYNGLKSGDILADAIQRNRTRKGEAQ